MDELKIRRKCEDMIAYGYGALRQFPKAERHVLSQEIRQSMWNLLRLIIICHRRYHKKTTMQDVLKAQLRRRIACADTLWLIDEIVDSTADPHDPFPRGVPIGNLTSQLFANVYLHDLDQLAKHELREARYLRYMDDFCVIHHDKTHLHAVRKIIEAFLWDTLTLRTNGKTQVYPVSIGGGRPLDFLGYRIWPTHRKLRKDSVRRMKRKLRSLQRRKAEGLTVRDNIEAVIASWEGHARHADTFNLRRKLLGIEGVFWLG